MTFSGNTEAKKMQYRGHKILDWLIPELIIPHTIHVLPWIFWWTS